MNDAYYRELIDRVSQNEDEMWNSSEDSDEGFDDFSQLWAILSDSDAGVSAQTFMDAAELCLTSFFGSTQDHTYVWESIAEHYRHALNNAEDTESFRHAFMAFAETYVDNEDFDCVTQFTEMMRMAIDAADAEMAAAITDCAFCSPLWESDRDYPEWSVWFAVFMDKDFAEVPRLPEAADTLNELYSRLGDCPGIDRLRDLHDLRI